MVGTAADAGVSCASRHKSMNTFDDDTEFLGISERLVTVAGINTTVLL